MIVEITDVDALAQIIRRVDGSNKLGAGALAEAIIAALSPAPQAPAGGAEAPGWRIIVSQSQPRLADGWSAVSVVEPGVWAVRGPNPPSHARAALADGGRDNG